MFIALFYAFWPARATSFNAGFKLFSASAPAHDIISANFTPQGDPMSISNPAGETAAAQKKRLRQEWRAHRDATHDPAVDAAVGRAFLGSQFYREAQTLFISVSFGSELDTHALIARALADGKRVAVPYCDARTHRMRPLGITRFPADLAPGTMGILEPDPALCAPALPEALDLVIVPGIAFTRRGVRLGYGGGYYDRFLAALPARVPTLALAPDSQIADVLPTEPHDRRFDWLLTEGGLTDCRRAAAHD
jgi:5-formyltetrahydrofolate cyclo-ligase